MIYFVLVDYFCLSVYFGVAKVTAKIVQMSEKHQVYLNVFPNAAYLMKIYIKEGGTRKKNEY